MLKGGLGSESGLAKEGSELGGKLLFFVPQPHGCMNGESPDGKHPQLSAVVHVF